MILTREKIIEEIGAGRLRIDPFREENLGPASYDFTLSREFRIFQRLPGVIDVREETDYRRITEKIQVEDFIVILPGESILGITEENVELPEDICGWIQGRSRFARLGLMVHITASLIQPGSKGKQVLEIFNAGNVALRLHPGTKICQVIFERCEGKSSYKGEFLEQEL